MLYQTVSLRAVLVLYHKEEKMASSPLLHVWYNCMHEECVVGGLSTQISFLPAMSVTSVAVFCLNAQQDSPVDGMG